MGITLDEVLKRVGTFLDDPINYYLSVSGASDEKRSAVLEAIGELVDALKIDDD